MSYNLLIVDDSEITRAFVRKTVGLSGIDVGKVLEAGNGLEALEVLGKEWVDIVFADINMPRMTGLELVERMSKDGLLQNIPVVIVSTERSKARIDELRQQGIKAYIKKPFKPEELRAVMIEVLGSAPGVSHDR